MHENFLSYIRTIGKCFFHKYLIFFPMKFPLQAVKFLDYERKIPPVCEDLGWTAHTRIHTHSKAAGSFLSALPLNSIYHIELSFQPLKFTFQVHPNWFRIASCTTANV